MKKVTAILLSVSVISNILLAKNDNLTAEEYQVLGFKYERVNKEKAKNYFEKSCNLNDSLGCSLFSNYLVGENKIKIIKKALKFYVPSSINKDYLAELYTSLGRAYKENNESKKACKNLKKACDLGLCNSYNSLCITTNKNIKAQNDLQVACMLGNLKLVKKFIKKADVNGMASDGWTPLVRASKNNYLEIVKYLVEHGADLNIKNSSGYTALHKASYSGHIEVVKYLLSKGAKIDIKDASKKTPLLISIDFYQIDKLQTLDTIELLLKKGANPKLKDNSNINALDIITLGLRQKNPQSKELFDLFKKYGY